MRSGSSDQVRAVASEKYIQPAIRAGKSPFTVAVKDVVEDLVSQGFPPGNIPQVLVRSVRRSFSGAMGLKSKALMDLRPR